MDAYRAQIVQERLDAMRNASAKEDTWQAWMKAPENSKFFNNLKLAHDFLPSFVKSRVEAADPHFQGINDDQYQGIMSYLTGGRIGKQKAPLLSFEGLRNNADLKRRQLLWESARKKV